MIILKDWILGCADHVILELKPPPFALPMVEYFMNVTHRVSDELQNLF